MTSKLTEVGVDCAEPRSLARFWCSALGYEVYAEHDDLVTIGPPESAGFETRIGPVPPTLTFALVPEGKTVKNRLHLDLSPGDGEQDAEVRRLVGLGARHTDVGQGDAA